MSADADVWDDLIILTPAEAAALLADRWDAGTAGDGLVDRWLAMSEDNRRAWQTVRDVWDSCEGWENDPALAAMRSAALAMRQHTRRPAWLSYAVAAMLVGVVSAGALTVFMHQRTESGRQLASMDRFGTPDFVTQDRQLDALLPDGTRIHLAPNSALDLAFANGARVARLERGEATFDVRHDSHSPFRVAAGGRVIADVGTLFSLNLATGKLEVRLFRGSVSISRGDDPARAPDASAIILFPGNELIAEDGQDRVLSPGASLQSPGASLSFDNVRLSNAVDMMNRTSSIKLVVNDPEVASLRISGSFRAGDPMRFARTLAELYPVVIAHLHDGRILIASAKRRR